jgi:hypothetical protein
MRSPTEILDDLLPLLQPHRAEILINASILEVDDVAQLAELAANPRIRCFLLGRLSDTAALIDPNTASALAKALLADGKTPKMANGMDR